MKTFLMIFGILLFPLALLAQEAEVILPPGIDWASYVSTFGVYVTTVLLVVEFLTGWLTSIRKWTIWFVALAIAVLGFIFKLGIFYDQWYWGIVYVILAGGIGYGYLTADKGQLIIDLLKEFFGKQTKSLFAKKE